MKRGSEAVQIVRYNWPAYVSGAVTCPAALLLSAYAPLPAAARLPLTAAAILAGFWLVASLAASYWVYDHSPLCRWTWIPDLLPRPPRRWANIHVGLDESTPALRSLYPGTQSSVVDVYDPVEMTEASIRRARRLTPPAISPTPAPFTALPFPDQTLDTVFLLFAAHEIRTPALRERFFQELYRVLEPGGMLLLVEHLRDLPNFLVFGPGCFHFHARREWRRLAREAGLRIAHERRFTPFVAVFLLEKDG